MLPSHHMFLHVIMTSLLAIAIRQYWNLLSAKNVLDHEELVVGKSVTQKSLGDSSVWCWGSNITDRLCRFRNLCYVPMVDEFLFLHGPDSVYIGLPAGRYEPALLDLSSVADHNAQYFNFMDALGDEVRRKFSDDKTTILGGTSVIFRRFHPTNLMHALHDDLLPLHNTLLSLSEEALEEGLDAISNSQRFKHRLVFADDYGSEPFEDLFSLMSVVPPTHKEDLHSMNDLVCFTESYVGLLKHSTWYQYGFTEPQGPIRGRTVTSRTIRKFCQYVRSQLNVSTVSESADGRSIAVLSRKYNRLILNEAELILALARNLRMKVVLLSLETHSISEIISTVSSASALIGMHGSLLSLAMFLPRGSVLLELFPYAVNPAHYTPYQTLAELPGMGIHYKSWRNLNVDKTVAHPNRSPAEGGISHLTTEKQASIKSSLEVPRHLCCSDPEWLFRIYQDTVVDRLQVLQKQLLWTEYCFLLLCVTSRARVAYSMTCRSCLYPGSRQATWSI
jgi:protein O-mannose beta-1,4-N-acetylglucosaminyltransferase